MAMKKLKLTARGFFWLGFVFWFFLNIFDNLFSHPELPCGRLSFFIRQKKGVSYIL